MKTIEEIRRDIDGLVILLAEKGKIGPNVSIEMHSQTERTHLWIRFKNSAQGDTKLECACGNTVDEALDEARELIRKMPSLKDAQLHEFMSNLGKLIDVGRDYGIEVEFLNPLTETMNRLSENIITFQPHIEAAE